MSPGGKGHSTQKHEWRTPHSRDTSRKYILRLWPPQSVWWLVLEQVQQDLKGMWFLVADQYLSVPSKEPDEQEVHICNPSSRMRRRQDHQKFEVIFSLFMSSSLGYMKSREGGWGE